MRWKLCYVDKLVMAVRNSIQIRNPQMKGEEKSSFPVMRVTGTTSDKAEFYKVRDLKQNGAVCQ